MPDLGKKSGSKLSVFLVDDDDTQELLVAHILDKSRLAVDLHYYDSPRAALEALCKDGEVCPDLIFLDINMPEMKGWEFLERADACRPNLPVVFMLSSSVFEQDRQRAQGYDSVKGFLIKPFDQHDVVEVEKALQAA